jgi:hypothetical protein
MQELMMVLVFSAGYTGIIIEDVREEVEGDC